MRTLAPFVVTAALAFHLQACSGDGGSRTNSFGSRTTATSGGHGGAGPSGRSVLVSERARRGLEISPVPLALEGLTDGDVERIGYGSYLVNAASDCNGCHAFASASGPPQFLAGGTPFALPPALGSTVYASNLTPSPATGMKLTEADFVEAFRTGRDFKTTAASMLVMPWPTFRWMTTADIKAIYAYLKAIPAVDNAVEADMKTVIPPVPMPVMYDEGDVARALPPDDIVDPDNVVRGYALQPLADPTNLTQLSVESQALFGRGSYLANAISNCSGCHTFPSRNLTPGPSYLKVNTAAYLAGGASFNVPPGLDAMLGQKRSMSANLTGEQHGSKDSFATFLALIAEGRKANEPGQPPVAWPMPWPMFRNLVREDLEALYAYVTTVPRRTGPNDKQMQEYAPYCKAASDCPAGGQTCAASNECVGAACSVDTDCAACQTCKSAVCAAPGAGSACVAQAM